MVWPDYGLSDICGILKLTWGLSVFDRPTVFILGAGASWHYGYPTGEELVRRVISKSAELAAFFVEGARANSGNMPAFIRRKVPDRPQLASDWLEAAQEARTLASRLKEVNPTLIDYFLAQNNDLHDIGKLAIALVIFDCERQYDHFRGNENHRHQYRIKADRGLAPRDVRMDITSFNDDWLRFVLYKLTTKCEASSTIAKNNVQFVTFNYDMSLERRLFLGLTNISHFKKEDINSFMQGNRFLHVYGSIREKVDEQWKPVNTTIETTYGNRFFETVDMLNDVYTASQGIRTIDGPDKTKNEAIIAEATLAISRAELIYILGFGFDLQNCARLGMAKLRPGELSNKTVFLTNYGGFRRVSTAAGTTLTGDPNAFRNNGGSVVMTPFLGNTQLRFRYEMSVKNVYDAIAEDFEGMEAI